MVIKIFSLIVLVTILAAIVGIVVYVGWDLQQTVVRAPGARWFRFQYNRRPSLFESSWMMSQ